MLIEDAVGLFRFEPFHRGRDHRAAMEPAREQDIHQTRHPRPVGRRPQCIVRLWKEIVGELEARHVPKHHAMRLH